MISRVLKALKCCANFKSDCEVCPYMGEEKCASISINDAINLIISQKEENERLEKEIERLDIELKAMRGVANSYKAEVERLKETFRKRVGREIEETYNYLLKEIKAEAIKEFADRLIEIGVQEGAYEYVSVYDIENIVKELREERF